MKFTFEEDKHTYRIDGKIVPSITQIIKPCINYDSVPNDVLQKACNYGTAVHKTVELYHKGTLDRQTLDMPLLDALMEYEAWELFSGFPKDPIVELPMPHERLGFAGTPDLIFDGVAIVEIKTRGTNRVIDAIQLAAQEKLWTANGGKPTKYSHHVLELLPGGLAKLVTFRQSEIKDGWSRFRFLLDHYKTTEQIKTWGTK